MQPAWPSVRPSHRPCLPVASFGNLEQTEADVIAAATWRRGGADGREAIAAAGEVVSIAQAYTPSQQFWGKITSKKPQRLSRADLELTAFRLGCSVESARRAIELGLI